MARQFPVVLVLFCLLVLSGLDGSGRVTQSAFAEEIKNQPRIDYKIDPKIIDPKIRDLDLKLIPAVTLTMPPSSLHVGSYYRIPVIISGPATFTFNDLRFVIPDGPKGGTISYSRDREFDPANPYIMLLAGYQPGAHQIQVINNLDNTTLATFDFKVDNVWMNWGEGPSRWMTGATGTYAFGSAWGGGSSGPQNLNVTPAIGTRRIAILLVDTSSQRYTSDPTELTNIRNRWMDNTINGAADWDGQVRSARQFFREVSYGNFDISAQIFGPVNVDQAWDVAMSGDWAQTCITAADSLVDYNNFDSILLASQSVPSTSVFYALNPDGSRRLDADGNPIQLGNSVWPTAWGGTYSTAEGNKRLAIVSMPNEWGQTIRPDRTLHSTIAHELGHNMGLPDEYIESADFIPSIAARQVAGWDIMAYEGLWPHFSIANRMRLGWIDASWIRTYNFAMSGVPIDQTTTLHPIELGSPAAGRFTGIEVRIADGFNYYFEYRNGQLTHIGDRYLPMGGNSVLGTDVMSFSFEAPVVRRTILLLNNDGDGDGPVLRNGLDYEETDYTDPAFPTDFRVDVSGIDGNKADVRIRYGINSRPDPSIRPWPSPSHQWQSPDIEVRNARNMADPAWANVPWDGNLNTVVAKIKNSGGLDAPGVRANFYVKNFNVGGAPETFLGSDTKDVRAGETVEFTTSWIPPREGHFCIIVRIPLYQNPTDMTVVETTELNNQAQSNYDRFISRSSSPPSREITFIEVGNPYPFPTRIWIDAGQTNPLYRTYVEHIWVWLNPGETRKVRVMFEFSPENMYGSSGLPSITHVPSNKDLQRFVNIPNKTMMAAFIEHKDYDNPLLLGGAEVEIVQGIATKFANFGAGQGYCSGRVTIHDGRTGVNGGKVLVRFAKDEYSQDFKYLTANVDASGSFSAKLDFGNVPGGFLKAFYVPSPGYGDCESELFKFALPY